MRNKIIVLMIAALFLTGCFGAKTTLDDLATITLSAGDVLIVEPGKTIKINAVGRSEDNKSVAIEPVWSLDVDTKGAITGKNPAVFTAAADATGTVTITATVNDVSEKITLTIAVPEITNVVAHWGWEPSAQGGETDRVVNKGSATRGGYSAENFFTGFNDPQQWVEWSMNIPEAGQYRLIVRYSTHADAPYVKRNFTLRGLDEDVTAAYIDETYNLDPGAVGNDSADKENDEWMFFKSDLLDLEAGEQVLRMTFIVHEDHEAGQQFSNVVQVGFVAVDPAEAVFTQAEYIDELDSSLEIFN